MFKIINDGKLPERATKHSAGFDVFANEDVVVGAGETKVIGLGIALDHEGPYSVVPYILDIGNYFLSLHLRSSMRVKGLTSLGTGIIDIDYQDEIKIVIHNPMQFNMIQRVYRDDVLYSPEYKQANNSHEIKKGDKIGQLILQQHSGWVMPSEYTKQEERTGGFGSTGSK